MLVEVCCLEAMLNEIKVVEKERMGFFFFPWTWVLKLPDVLPWLWISWRATLSGDVYLDTRHSWIVTRLFETNRVPLVNELTR